MVSGSKKKVLVAGATGYIGKAVVAELLDKGYFVYAIVRKEKRLEYSDQSNLKVLSLEAGENSDWTKQLPRIDIIISCLASRSGCERDANFVDYSLNSDLLYFALKIKLQHFKSKFTNFLSYNSRYCSNFPLKPFTFSLTLIFSSS